MDNKYLTNLIQEINPMQKKYYPYYYDQNIDNKNVLMKNMYYNMMNNNNCGLILSIIDSISEKKKSTDNLNNVRHKDQRFEIDEFFEYLTRNLMDTQVKQHMKNLKITIADLDRTIDYLSKLSRIPQSNDRRNNYQNQQQDRNRNRTHDLGEIDKSKISGFMYLVCVVFGINILVYENSKNFTLYNPKKHGQLIEKKKLEKLEKLNKNKQNQNHEKNTDNIENVECNIADKENENNAHVHVDNLHEDPFIFLLLNNGERWGYYSDYDKNSIFKYSDTSLIREILQFHID